MTRTSPTSAQYALAVAVAHAARAAISAGAIHDEVIATLRQCVELAERNKAFHIEVEAKRASYNSGSV